MPVFTDFKHLNVPDPGTPNWDVPVNADWRAIDMALAGTQYINLANFSGNVYLTNITPSGSSDPATSLSCQPAIITVFGSPTGACNIVFPNALPGHWLIRNAIGTANGTFAVNVVTSTGSYNFMPVPLGVTSHVITDGSYFAFVGASGTPSQLAMVGEIKIFGGGWVPAQWCPCDGRWLDKNTYINLFNVFAYAYGGNGSTAFAVPDLRGRVVAGPDSYGTGTGAAGRMPGWVITSATNEYRAWIGVDQMPSHNHNGGNHLHGAWQDGHRHSLPLSIVSSGTPGAAAGMGWGLAAADSGWVDPVPAVHISYSGDTIAYQGSGNPISLIQPSIALNYIIYTGV